MKKPDKGTEAKTIEILPLKLRVIKVPVKAIDESTYIPHRLGKETMAGIKEKITGKAKKGKKIRNFEKEYESCFYYTEDKKYGIPACAFAGAALDAAVACNIPKTQIKRAVRFLGDVYELEYKKINHRVDYPRQSGATKAPDIRHRPEFVDWSCELYVQYDENQITEEQVVNLIEQAGFSSGVGDWRPNPPKGNPGIHGMFSIVKG